MNISEIKNILNTNIGNYHAFTFSDLRHVFGGALPLCLYSMLSLLVSGRKEGRICHDFHPLGQVKLKTQLRSAFSIHPLAIIVCFFPCCTLFQELANSGNCLKQSLTPSHFRTGEAKTS